MTSLSITFSSQPRTNRLSVTHVCEALLAAFIWCAGLTGFCAVAAIFVVLAIGAAPAYSEVATLRFVTGMEWAPSADQYEILLMIVGTVAVSLGAILVAGPVAILCAIYLEYYARPLSRLVLRIILQGLAGIPSVVYGLWGLTSVVPLITAIKPPGTSLLAGIIVLSIMVLPTISILIAGALHQVPSEIYRGALALGCSKYRTIVWVILPVVRSAILAAVVLGLARALGETMAVLMVTGNSLQSPDSLFAPIRTLPANIALEMAYATDKHRAALIASGAVLTALVLALHFVTRRSEPCDAV